MVTIHFIQNRGRIPGPGRFFGAAKCGVPLNGHAAFLWVWGLVQPSLSRAMICSTICRSAPAPLS